MMQTICIRKSSWGFGREDKGVISKDFVNWLIQFLVAIMQLKHFYSSVAWKASLLSFGGTQKNKKFL